MSSLTRSISTHRKGVCRLADFFTLSAHLGDTSLKLDRGSGHHRADDPENSCEDARVPNNLPAWATPQSEGAGLIGAVLLIWGAVMGRRTPIVFEFSNDQIHLRRTLRLLRAV